MKYLIGFNIIAFAITLFIVMTLGYDMETKDKAMILVLMPMFVGLISIGAFLMTEDWIMADEEAEAALKGENKWEKKF